METPQVLEYKCPCCNAGLRFAAGTKTLTCEYCENTFDLDTLQTCEESARQESVETLTWEQPQTQSWSLQEQSAIQVFQCPACGGEIMSDENTAATFCPYCDNPTVLSSRLSGGLKPDAILPFQKTKEDAKAAFLRLCSGKPLLPKGFTSEHRLERITGMYVPFWLYDCDGDFYGTYNATRVHHWADAKYNYTRTDHFLLQRAAQASFQGIPMDGSSKMDDCFMESIEPFDISRLQSFDSAYLTGFLADKYDVGFSEGEERIRQRVDQSIRDQLQSSLLGYASVLPTSRQLQVAHSKCRYALLPVWILNTNYKGKIYTFAMNGQTGKMTGSFPICPKRSAAWFCGVFAGVTVLVHLLQMLL